jgi:hypothetical protein
VLVGFVAPEGELLAFNSLCRLGWSFSGNPAGAAEMLGLATQPTPLRLPCQNQGEIHGRVRIAYLSGLVACRKALNRYAMRTLRRLRGFKCWVWQPSLPPLKAAVLGAANGKNLPCVTSDLKIAYPIIFFERP